jgi:hypothetical protein
VQGTINIQLPPESDDRLLVPNKRVPGCDPIDENQDFLIRPCTLKGISGFQVLPIDKITGEPRGHHGTKRIEVSLRERIALQMDEELEVELLGFED